MSALERSPARLTLPTVTSPAFLRRAARSARQLWPEAIVLAAVFIAFRSTLLGEAHFPFDAEFYNYPLWRDVQNFLSHGALPAWDAYSYGGTPLLANAQSAWLYPPHLILDGILALTGHPLTEHMLDVLAIAHVALAGVGTAAVARGRRLGNAGAAFAGVFVVLSGAVVSQAQHPGETEMLAWLPLAVLAVDRIADRGVNVRRVTALAVLFALSISVGYLPMVPVFAVLLLGAAVARGARRLPTFVGTAGGLVCGVIMAAAVLVPIGSMLSAYAPLGLFGPMPTDSLVTTILPNAVGHWQPTYATYIGVPSLPAGGLTNSYYYVGGAAIFLLPIALASGRAAAGEAILVLVLMLATFGAPAAEIAHAIQALPAVGPLWRPELVVYVVSIPLALLLARGLSRPPTVGQLAIAFATLAVLSAISFSNLHGRRLLLLTSAPAQELAAVAATAVLLCGACLVSARRRQSRTVPVVLALAAVIGCADLAAAASSRYFINWPGEASAAGAHTSGDGSTVVSDLQSRVSPEQRIAADIDNLPAAWGGFAPIWQLSDVNGFQPQFSKYQLARVEKTGAFFEGHDRTFPIVPAVVNYLRELNVRYVVTSPTGDRFAKAPGYQRVLRDDTYRVYRVPGDQTRAYAVDSRCTSRNESVETCRTGPAVSVRLTGQSTRELQIAHAARAPLNLITGEVWYPGWHASAGGRSLPVRRVGYLAAVSVPPGVTRVNLSFQVRGLLVGVVLSIMAIVGAGAATLLFPGYRRNARQRSLRPSVKA